MLSPDFSAKCGVPDFVTGARGDLDVKMNRIPHEGRIPLVASLSAVCLSALLAGCIASPTYGTGKSANAQLMDDVTGILAIGGSKDKKSEIAYTPRPELVKPASLEVLPQPQENVAAAGNPAWPESPEERRARIRADATANQDNPFYEPLARTGNRNSTGETTDFTRDSSPGAQTMDVRGTREQFNQRVRQNRQGDPNTRRYLSEPPTAYRKPSDAAPVGDVGEDEWLKERKNNSASGKSWRDIVPWL